MYFKNLARNLIKNLAKKLINFTVDIEANLKPKMKIEFDQKLKGSKQLDKKLFNAKILVPAIKIKKVDYGKARKILKPFVFDTLRSAKKYTEIDPNNVLSKTHKYILLDPDLFDFEKLELNIKKDLVELIENNDISNGENIIDSIEKINVELDYDDLKFEDVMKAIIPDNLLNENITAKGYSVIGHIAHFNLKDQMLDYKNIIGQVLIDKMPTIKTVVNKLNTIDNTYRNFSLEILAGEKNTLVQCKENGCQFKFDFAKVYWNPRLGFEHERVVKLLDSNDVLYDVFAGVGPFSIPAVTTRKLNAVLANDLNPDSYRHLIENYNLNNRSKTKSKEIKFKKSLICNTTKTPVALIPNDDFKFNPSEAFLAFNLDGNDFIRKKIKFHLVEILNYRLANKIELEIGKFYVLMNLPAMSIEFLNSFNNLYDENETKIIKENFDEDFLKKFRMNIFCYHFAKSEEDDLNDIKGRIIKDIFKDESLSIDSKFVRKVAPKKDMFCSMFQLKFSNMFAKEDDVKNFGEKEHLPLNGNNKVKLNELDVNDNESPNKFLKTN